MRNVPAPYTESERAELLATLAAMTAKAMDINERLGKCANSDTEQLIAIYAERGALNNEARALGFTRLFDGRFRLSMSQVERAA